MAVVADQSSHLRAFIETQHTRLLENALDLREDPLDKGGQGPIESDKPMCVAVGLIVDVVDPSRPSHLLSPAVKLP